MNLLKECERLRRKIQDIDEKIEKINTILYYPKCQDLSGMPKGEGSGESIIDKLITKKGKLEATKANIVKEQNNKWSIIEKACNNAHISKTDIMLIKLRYYHGLPWKSVKLKLCDYTGQEWNDNKIFRVHHSVLCKINNEVEKLA